MVFVHEVKFRLALASRFDEIPVYRWADFLIDGKTFEVGSRNKKQKQLQGVEDGYIVKDGIETGHLNVIPLWQFGLNY